MIINMWSSPRNISTALMYSFANRNDCVVIDEPYYAHYLKLTGLNHPGKEEVLSSQSTDIHTIHAQIEEKSLNKSITFLKNMGHHSIGIPPRMYEKFVNIFLVRDPLEMITSFIKNIPEPTLQDTGYQYQFELLEQELNRGKNPIVINSKNLLTNPEMYLSRLCEKLDIEFQDSMLKWKAGSIIEDGVWAKYWYGAVHKSTCFLPYEDKMDKVPNELQGLLAECNSYFNQIMKYAL